MSKRKPKRQPVKQPRREEGVLLFEPWEWHDAEQRLKLMEEAARRAISGTGPLNVRIVTPVEPPRVPLLLPARMGDILLGPDGRPLQGVTT